ncbi:MAG TPA: hypothetical protein VF792_13180 [Ktedonobacterales bacterium]
MAMHWEVLPFLFIGALVSVAPIIVGFTFVRVNANRIGQPGWLWAFLTIPLGWIAILAYLVVRAITPTRI